MNMTTTTAVSIPEGNVVKINRSTQCLWQREPEVVCNPYIAVTVRRSGTVYTVSAYIRGISQKLVLELAIYTGTNGTANTRVTGISTNGRDTVKGYTSGNYARTSTSGTPCFALRLIYRDLTNRQRTLWTPVCYSGTTNAQQ